MDAKRFGRMLDIMIAIALFQIVHENIGIPYPRTLGALWRMHREIFRAGTSVLWLTALWLGQYRVGSEAKRLPPAALPWGAALMLCILATPWFTQLIVQSTQARLSQALYGAFMMTTLAAGWLLRRAMERGGALPEDCAAASARYRRAQAVAFGLLAAGLAISQLRYRPAMYNAVAAASLWLLVAPLCRRRAA